MVLLKYQMGKQRQYGNQLPSLFYIVGHSVPPPIHAPIHALSVNAPIHFHLNRSSAEKESRHTIHLEEGLRRWGASVMSLELGSPSVGGQLVTPMMDAPYAEEMLISRALSVATHFCHDLPFLSICLHFFSRFFHSPEWKKRTEKKRTCGREESAKILGGTKSV